MAVLGDEKAIKQLYVRLHKKIRAYFFNKVRALDTAEDLTADTFIALLERLPDLTAHPGTGRYWDAVSRWSSRTALYIFRAWRRKHQVRRKHTNLVARGQPRPGEALAASVPAWLVEACPLPRPDEFLIRREQTEQAQRTMMRVMPDVAPSNRDLMEDHYLHETTTRELSMKYGISKAAVRKRLSRCRAELREAIRGLADYGDGSNE